MAGIVDKIKSLLFGVLKAALCKALDFFKKPKLLTALKAASLVTLTSFLDWTKEQLNEKINEFFNKDDNPIDVLNPKTFSDSDIMNFVKTDKNTKEFMNLAGNDINEEMVSDIVKFCENPEANEETLNNLVGALSGDKELSGDDYLRIIEKENDFELKTESSRLSNRYKDLLNKVEDNATWLFLGYAIGMYVKDLITNSEYPSRYRGKYLQKLIRSYTSVLKGLKNGNRKSKSKKDKISLDQINQLIKYMLKLDTIVSAGLLAAFIYINNRIEYQKASIQTLKDIAGSVGCEVPKDAKSDEQVSEEAAQNSNGPLTVDPFSEEFQSKFIPLTLACPVDNDDVIVPHKSFEDKLKDFSCVIDPPKREDPNIEESVVGDLATKAIIENRSKKNFNILVKKDDTVDTRTVIATLGTQKIYAPVNGIVMRTNEDKEEIRIEDIYDPEKTYLEDLLQEVQDLYQQHNEVKFFIKDFFIDSWYPPMLQASPLIDASISGKELLSLKYLFGGVEKRWENIKDKADNLKDSYQKNAKKITNKDNVQEKAENENLQKIKVDLDSLENAYYKNLQSLSTLGTNQARVTRPSEKEFSLIDYYLDLLNRTLSYFEQNDTVISFRDGLSEIITERFFVESWNLTKLKNKINDYCEKLAEGTFFEETPNFYNRMMYRYNRYKNVKSVENYVKKLSDKNTDYTEEEKAEITDKVMFLFNFQLGIVQKVNRKYATKTNIYQLTNKEANFIKGFFRKLRSQYLSIPNQLEQKFKIIDDLGASYIPYSVITQDEEEWRYYGIGEERKCPIPSTEDEYLSPFSYSGIQDFSDINYWFKYCSIATLVGITNFPLGWATGFPPPFGPIPLPVVYIPIKAFQLQWGFIVLGITITGIYPFPWVLIVNYETLWHMPVADPATIIKNQVKALKKEVLSLLQSFKRRELKGYMDEKESEINSENQKIDDLKKAKRQHKLSKPRRDRTKNSKEDKERYNKELADWEAEQERFDNEIETSKSKRYESESKHKVVADVYSGTTTLKKAKYDPNLKICSNSGAVRNYDNLPDNTTKPSYENTPDNNPPEIAADPKIRSLEKSEEQVEKKFKLLDTLINSINSLLSTIPGATEPMSANFAFTVKNPKPIIQIKDDLEDSINRGVLDPILEKYEVKNEDLTDTSFKRKMGNSIVNYGKFTKALSLAMPFIIKQDPFPKYENLKLSNVPWISFLFSRWSVTGAKTYGFPGFPQYPT